MKGGSIGRKERRCMETRKTSKRGRQKKRGRGQMWEKRAEERRDG